MNTKKSPLRMEVPILKSSCCEKLSQPLQTHIPLEVKVTGLEVNRLATSGGADCAKGNNH